MPYVNPVAAHARVIPHNYFDYSDAPGQASADSRDLQAVTAAFMANDDMADVPFYIRRGPDGCAAFVECDGVDPMVDGSAVDIWTYGGSCYSNQSPTTEVYVRKSALTSRGHEIPANANPGLAAIKALFQ